MPTYLLQLFLGRSNELWDHTGVPWYFRENIKTWNGDMQDEWSIEVFHSVTVFFLQRSWINLLETAPHCLPGKTYKIHPCPQTLLWEERSLSSHSSICATKVNKAPFSTVVDARGCPMNKSESDRWRHCSHGAYTPCKNYLLFPEKQTLKWRFVYKRFNRDQLMSESEWSKFARKERLNWDLVVRRAQKTPEKAWNWDDLWTNHILGVVVPREGHNLEWDSFF